MAIHWPTFFKLACVYAMPSSALAGFVLLIGGHLFGWNADFETWLLFSVGLGGIWAYRISTRPIHLIGNASISRRGGQVASESASQNKDNVSDPLIGRLRVFFASIKVDNTSEALFEFAFHAATGISQSFELLNRSSSFSEDLMRETGRVLGDLESGLLTNRAKAQSELHLIWLESCGKKDRMVFAIVNRQIEQFFNAALSPTIANKVWKVPDQM